MNTALATQLLLGLLQTAGPAIAAITQAKAEGRDLTDDELGALFSAEQIAAAKLDSAIAAG